ncbi:MAG TPA: PilZ domain-containing protein [Gammaproteobacteria bacterium]|nr:PilZ domain-containing protein [Gammaproteobacteria bacterium]
MEHRCSVRRSLRFQLMLYRQGIPVQRAVSRNLGMGGVLVDAGTSKWRKNEMLEIEFMDAEQRPVMRLPAVVVHQSDGGTGLMFGRVTARQRHNLRRWLYGGTGKPVAADTIAVA